MCNYGVLPHSVIGNKHRSHAAYYNILDENQEIVPAFLLAERFTGRAGVSYWGSGRLARSDGRRKTFISRGRDASALGFARLGRFPMGRAHPQGAVMRPQ